MNKLVIKLKQLVLTSKVEYWNGGSIKKSVVGNSSSKIFQCDGIKYKLELRAESKCDNNTNFIPTTPEIFISNWIDGRYYTGEKAIAKFLNITTKQVLDIYSSMISQCVFDANEIRNSVASHESFVVNFRKDFCLDGHSHKDEFRDDQINIVLS